MADSPATLRQSDLKELLYEHIADILPKLYTAARVAVKKSYPVISADLPAIGLKLMSDSETDFTLGDDIGYEDVVVDEFDELAESPTEVPHVLGTLFDQTVEVRLHTVNSDQRQEIRQAMKGVLFVARQPNKLGQYFRSLSIRGGADFEMQHDVGWIYGYPWTVRGVGILELRETVDAIADVTVDHRIGS